MSASPQPLDRREPLPEPVPDGGYLYLASPLEHTNATIRSLARRLGLATADAGRDVISVHVPPGELRRFCDLLAEGLSLTTLQDTRSLLKESAKSPTLADLVQMRPLATLIGRARADWLIDMLRSDRLVVHFQPVVSCERQDTVVGHECLVRGVEHDGTLVHRVHMTRAAGDAGLRYQLDRQARLTAIRSAGSHGVPGLVFVDVDASAVYEPASCLQSLARAVADAAISPDRMVLETTADAATDDLTHVLALATSYRSAGFRVALDDVGGGHGSFGLVGRLRPDFVKIGVELGRSAARDARAAEVATRIIELAHSSGAQVVATGIERQEDWAWFCAHGADFAQGDALARPGVSSS